VLSSRVAILYVGVRGNFFCFVVSLSRRWWMLQEEVDAGEALATSETVLRLRQAYDTQLRNESSPAIAAKLAYGAILCFSPERGLMRRGIDLLEEVYEFVCAHPNLAKEMKEEEPHDFVVLSHAEALDNDAGDSASSDCTDSVQASFHNVDPISGKELLDSKFPSTCLYYIAVAHFRLGQYSTAIENCDKLLDIIDPENERAKRLRDACVYNRLSRRAIGVALTLGVVLPAVFLHRSASGPSQTQVLF